MSGPSGQGGQGVVELNLLPPAVVRRRARGLVGAAVLLGAATGGLVGLLGGRTAGLVAAAVVAAPLLVFGYAEARRRCWLTGSVVALRAISTRRVDITTADRLALVVSDLRAQRTVSLLVAAAGRRPVPVALAIYTPAGGIELGVLELRRLADALAVAAERSGDQPARTLSSLLIAQLRAEARGEAAPARPLWLAAGLAPAGPVRTVAPDRLAAFVSELD